MAELKCQQQPGSSSLPSFPVFHLWPFWPRIQYQGQRMNLALSLPRYLRTSGSEPGVLHRVSPSFQLNRLSEYPGLLRDSPLLPTWFCSLEPPNKSAVPKWIGFHCDRLIRSHHLHLDQVTAIQSAQWHLHRPQVLPQRAQLPSPMGGCSQLQSPPVTSTTVASHCSKSPGRPNYL